MTVNVISVGLSVFDALDHPDNWDDDAGKPKFPMDRAVVTAIRKARPSRLLDGRTKQESNDWLTAAFTRRDTTERARLTDMAGSVCPTQWPLNMSAEIETFRRVHEVGGFAPDARDIAVLVCSDTPAGLVAGLWNALAIADGDLGRVRYVADAAASPEGFLDQDARVFLVRVTGLDASNTLGFQRAMGALCTLARDLFASGRLAQGEEFRFYLSGGYKATIPYLIGMAEAVHSVDAPCLEQLGSPGLMPGVGRWPVKAFMLHEAAPPGAPPIELPLRRLVATAVRKELTEWKDGKRTGKPPSALLEGYAYEVGQGPDGREPCELTPFGAGLRALFGLSREGFW